MSHRTPDMRENHHLFLISTTIHLETSGHSLCEIDRKLTPSTSIDGESYS